MPDELARGLATGREAKPVHHVVQPALQRCQQVVSGDARERRHILERVPELLFGNTVNALDLLFLAKLLRVFRCLAATRRGLAMLAGCIRPAFHRALLREALGSLQEQLRPFAPALPAAWSRVAHRSDSPALRGTAAVMRNRRDVLDRLDLQAR